MDLLKTFKEIPAILNNDLTPETAVAWVKDEFEKKLGFDFVLIGYLNVDNIDIKAMTDPDNKVSFVAEETVGISFKEFLENKKGLSLKVFANSKSILTELGIKPRHDCVATILPLIIKGAVFGLVLALKFNQDEISEENFAVAQAYAGICAYIIKDAELSNVFKLQLKILNENIVEKTYTIEDIKDQNDKIKEAEKIKTDFLLNMSHSLRTPLNAIIGFSEALQMKVFGELNTKQEEYIIDIQNSGKEMLGLVNDILDMSKIEAGAMKVLKTDNDISLLICEAVNIVRSLASKKEIEIINKVPAIPIHVMLDTQKFNQIMYNLLSNAVKFTNKNGYIEVGIKELKDTIQIYVKDNGIGIDKKYHGKIFGKFEQVDSTYANKYASTGLGLTITKELVEMHNGRIWLESKVNNGTTFTVELPLE